jgi:peptide/nickel transport system ATP-binding protein
MLCVRDLRITLPTPYGPAAAVRGISFDMQRGDTLGLVGESGCGKSLTAMALLGLLPQGATVSGSIQFNGTELTTLGERGLRRLRGNRIAMVFQEPMTALNPLHTVGDQVAEPLRLHQGLSRAAAHAKARHLLDRVGIADATRRCNAYPHQFSGGQRQRITIAMALACGPDLLLADEPTTALDATVAGEVLQLMHELVHECGMGLLLISHDLGVIAQHTARTLVMYGGQVVESGPTPAVFHTTITPYANPSHPTSHPYTRGLFAARPRFGMPIAPPTKGLRPRLPSIPGSVPELHQLPSGCPFAGRCDVAQDSCATDAPPTVTIGPQHHARCSQLHATPTHP